MRCIVCGNEIKDNSLECPICGSKQLGTPIYNTQQFTDLQHQINNMHINNNTGTEVQNNYYGVNQPQPMVQQPMMQQPVQPVQPVQPNNYYQPTGYINQTNMVPVKQTSGRDVVGVISNIIGGFYSFSVLIVILSGMDELRKRIDEEILSLEQYKDLANDRLALTLSLTMLLFITGIISLATSLSSRKVRKTTLNTINLIVSIIILAVACFSTWYFYNYL